jgi:replicative DNA helicase
MRNGHNILEPHNVEAEEATLGALIIDPDTVLGALDAGLRPADFFTERNGWIFGAIMDLMAAGKPADLITLTDELQRRRQLEEIGGPAYLTHLLSQPPSSLWAGQYAEIIKRQSVLRQLIRVSARITKMAHQESLEPGEAIRQASEMLLELARNNQASDPRHVSHFCQEAHDILERLYSAENGILGLPTGLGDIDKILDGLQRGKLVLIAGRPGMGKSSLALQMAHYGAKKHQAKALFFSLEMTGVEITQRLLSAETGIDSKVLQRGPIEDGLYAQIMQATDTVSRLPLHIEDQATSIEDIRAQAISHRYRHGLDLLVVDYIQRVQAGKNYYSRDAEVGAVSSALKQLALNLNIPVLAVSSLSRKCEDRHDKRPKLSDLRDSGNLEYDADVVMFLYCDDVYYPNSDFPNIAEVNVAKHRGGPLGQANLYFKRHLTTFTQLEVRRQPLYQV